MNPKKARELVRIYDAVAALFLLTLRDGKWHSVDALRPLIPPELAADYYKVLPDWIAAGPDKNDTIVGTYRRLLATAIRNDLAEQGICERRCDGMTDDLRLVKSK